MNPNKKTILITGATDGLGLATARALYAKGHRILLHGRSATKLAAARDTIAGCDETASANRDAPFDPADSYLADLSVLKEVKTFARAVARDHATIDVIINNAGVFQAAETRTADNLDIRFAVNTFAPFLLTRLLMSTLTEEARVVNLSSAAQSPVDLQALEGQRPIADAFNAYAQSKLALTMWSAHQARRNGGQGPLIVAVNPGSLLATKMVKEGFGQAGNDIQIGADILVRAALSSEFEGASGKYFDNDKGAFSAPHIDALNAEKCQAVVASIGSILQRAGVSC
ncbi:SDR family NAD(P)-dependent oxidoreductase [Microbulbifer sp. ARAS458-1]|uniref:SDR family NAD(P)-dependent oxidoreductase n=1 Tax=Microbulbifer sp. ARAS458-1 TaxID=3140242 RepID=UPI003877921F